MAAIIPGGGETMRAALPASVPRWPSGRSSARKRRCCPGSARDHQGQRCFIDDAVIVGVRRDTAILHSILAAAARTPWATMAILSSSRVSGSAIGYARPSHWPPASSSVDARSPTRRGDRHRGRWADIDSEVGSATLNAVFRMASPTMPPRSSARSRDHDGHGRRHGHRPTRGPAVPDHRHRRPNGRRPSATISRAVVPIIFGTTVPASRPCSWRAAPGAPADHRRTVAATPLGLVAKAADRRRPTSNRAEQTLALIAG